MGGLLNGTLEWNLQAATVIVPVLSGLVVTIISRFQFKEKWAHVMIASAELVRQIYFFRASIGPYSLTDFEEDETAEVDGQEDVGLSAGARAKEVRMRFVRRVNDILRKTMNVSLNDDYLRHGRANASQQLSVDTVSEYVRETLCRDPTSSFTSPSSACWCSCRRRRRTARTMPSDSSLHPAGFHVFSDEQGADAKEIVEPGAAPGPTHVLEAGSFGVLDSNLAAADDGVRSMTAEMYFESRLARLVTMYSRDAPRLARHHNTSDMVTFICGFLASMLGAFEYSSWLPVILGFSGMLTIMSSHSGSRLRLSAINQALAELTQLDIQWQALSNVDRRTPRLKCTIIERTERVVFGVQIAIAGSVAVSATDDTQVNDSTSKKRSKGEKGQKEEVENLKT